MTDADGRFVFRGLAAGAYSITAIKPGYLDGAVGRRRPGGAGQPLPLAAGEKAGDVTIAVWRYATISGSVSDEAGEPVVGLEIRALKRALVGGRRRFTQTLSSIRETSTTDDRGQFRISGLAPGDYVVVAVSAMTSVPMSTLEAYRDAVQTGGGSSLALFRPIFEAGASSAMPGTPGAMAIGTSVLSLQRTVTPPPAQGGKIFVYPTTYYPAAVSAAQAGIVTIGSGEERSAVDFHLGPVPASRVTGTVTSADGAVASLALTLTMAAASDTAADTDAVAGTVTDANGAFTFAAVPVGQYTLRGMKQPPSSSDAVTTSVIQIGGGMTYATTFSGGTSQNEPLPTTPILWTSQPLSVGRTDITNVGVVLQPGPHVSGRVEFDGMSAKPRGDALPSIPIALDGEVSRSPALGFPAFANTQWPGRFDAAGAFTSVSLPGGRYYVRVTGGPRGWSFKSAMLNGRDVSEVPLDVSADVDGVIITFTDQPAELSGIVRTDDGTPDPSATVVVFPADPQAWASPAPNSRRFRAVRAGRDGVYKASAMPAGNYYVMAIPDEAAGDWNEPKYLEQLARLATEVRIDDGDKKRHDLKTREVR